MYIIFFNLILYLFFYIVYLRLISL